MDISATLTLDTGPFASALATVMASIEALGGESASMSSALADAQARLKELAAGSDAAAAAQSGATAATQAHAAAVEHDTDAAKENKQAVDEQNTALGQAKAGMSAVGAATNVLSGNAVGAAQSVVGMSGAFKALGVSMSSIPVIALAAALAALVVKLHSVWQEARQARLDEAFDNAKRSADGLRESIQRVNAAMADEAALARELRGISSGSADVKGQIALAKLERERQEALRGKSTEEQSAINAEYDRRKNQLEHDNSVVASRRNVKELESQKTENNAQLLELRQQHGVAYVRAQSARKKAHDEFIEAGDTVGNWRKQPHLDEAKRYNDLADSLDVVLKDTAAKIKALEAANTVIDAKITAEKGNVDLADANLQAANATVETSIANAVREAVAEKPGGVQTESTGGDKTGQIGGGEGRIDSDRLARIGGFVGATVGPSRYDRENNQFLRQIAENTRNGGAANAVFG